MAELLKPGKNIIVIRVTNNAGKGGFVPDKPYYLVAGNDSIDLRGEWYYKVGQVLEPFFPDPEQVPRFLQCRMNQLDSIIQWLPHE